MDKFSKKDICAYIRKHHATKNAQECADAMGCNRKTIFKYAKELGISFKVPALAPDKAIEKDRSKKQADFEKRLSEQKYRLLLDENNVLRKTIKAINVISKFQTYEIKPHVAKGGNEATAVIVASDWHVAESINKGEVNGLNEYNLDIARLRAEQFFKNSVRIIEVLNKDIKIPNIVLALLGDFINNMMFEEAQETNLLQPMREVIFAQELIASGIEYILKNTKCDLLIPCASGNHGRISRKPRTSATEAGKSLEYLMYCTLAQYFRDEKRVKFIIDESYHTYINVYGLTMCLHHGHDVRYLGGIGGVTVPMYKAISGWENGRKADLYVCGHFHQYFDAGRFVINGSMVGYNAYAISIKASFEKPKQMLFLIDKNRKCKTVTVPILFDQ